MDVTSGVGATGTLVPELPDDDRTAFARLVREDPIVNAVVDSRLCALVPISARRFGGTVVAVRDNRSGDDAPGADPAADGGKLRAAAFSGGNLLPVGGGPDEWRAIAAHVASRPRVATSIVGRAPAVEAMWEVLEPVWGPARAIRRDQRLLMLDHAVAERPPDVGLRIAKAADIDRYLPAAASMFTEELGVSPFDGANPDGYRARIAALVREGRAFCVTDKAGEVLFKADLGVVTPRTCQIQGVWVRPDLRGQGMGTAAMVGVLDHALAAAPTASLYVNDFNVAARRMYDSLGMTQVARLATVLL